MANSSTEKTSLIGKTGFGVKALQVDAVIDTAGTLTHNFDKPFGGTPEVLSIGGVGASTMSVSVGAIGVSTMSIIGAGTGKVNAAITVLGET